MKKPLGLGLRLGLSLCFFFASPLFLRSSSAADQTKPTTILYNTNSRADYNFDIYTLPIPPDSQLNAAATADELLITDGHSVNFNGHFPSRFSPSLLSLLPSESLASDLPPLHVVYVTERNGTSSIYLDAVYYDGTGRGTRRSTLQVENRIQVPLVGRQQSNGVISMKDKPSLVGDSLIYVSTHEDSGVPRRSWAAVYSTHLRSGLTRRLSPRGVPDFSPAVSPSGVWTAVASSGEDGWAGTLGELRTDIYIFRTDDGSDRVKVAEHGGWPTWADESTLYFHRWGDDGWWSIYKATLPNDGPIGVNSVVTQRVTPPGLHAFTPAASVANKSFIAVATRRPGSNYRHVELFDVVSKLFTEITRPISPKTHHLNPFISPDSTRIGYHRCRGSKNRGQGDHLLFEYTQSPLADISLIRIYWPFPSFSPEGDRITYAGLPGSGLHVVNLDGSGTRELYSGLAFGTSWNPKIKGLIYTSVGPIFAPTSTEVDVISVNADDEEHSYKKLTTDGKNNAFPSASPDGKWVVFRSGRSGYKNLYIMDAIEGDKAGLQRVTDGSWTDTHCSWSPDGDWIIFASNRDKPGSDSYQLYMVHPNGTELRKVFGDENGVSAHPTFSPDGKSIVFTSDHAGVSAEPISNAHQYQPSSEIFTMKLDGSGLTRWTHNSFDDGTPAWGPMFMTPVDVDLPTRVDQCFFDDCYWVTFPNQNMEARSSVQRANAPCG
ncbi:uncharacterized protein LOC127808824 [Diospyros lotus]|uniref:uncharacterized protein LOC127808824 n=1 Tax=Diospyros lotus TaxID=55363 RepID=UPI00224E8FF2|nr:uncharacterized protein LOC127808824 [Diospyros lotus]